MSSVQMLLSGGHVIDGPETQAPAEHASPMVQTLPSVQAALLSAEWAVA